MAPILLSNKDKATVFLSSLLSLIGKEHQVREAIFSFQTGDGEVSSEEIKKRKQRLEDTLESLLSIPTKMKQGLFLFPIANSTELEKKIKSYSYEDNIIAFNYLIDIKNKATLLNNQLKDLNEEEIKEKILNLKTLLEFKTFSSNKKGLFSFFNLTTNNNLTYFLNISSFTKISNKYSPKDDPENKPLRQLHAKIEKTISRHGKIMMEGERVSPDREVGKTLIKAIEEAIMATEQVEGEIVALTSQKKYARIENALNEAKLRIKDLLKEDVNGFSKNPDHFIGLQKIIAEGLKLTASQKPKPAPTSSFSFFRSFSNFFTPKSVPVKSTGSLLEFILTKLGLR